MVRNANWIAVARSRLHMLAESSLSPVKAHLKWPGSLAQAKDTVNHQAQPAPRTERVVSERTQCDCRVRQVMENADAIYKVKFAQL